MTDLNEIIDVAVIKYAQSCMESGEVTMEEYRHFKSLVNSIIDNYYPNWNINND